MNVLQYRLDLAARYFYSQKLDYLAEFIYLQSQFVSDINNGLPYWCVTYYTPGELLSIFDLKYVCIERLAGLSAANQLIKDLDSYEEDYKKTNWRCSYQLMFHALLKENIIPKPSGFIAANYTCDDAYSYCIFASNSFQLPMYFIDVPKFNSDDTYKYIGKQLENIQKQLSKTYPEYQTIDSISKISNKTLEIKQKIDSLRIKYPGILSSMDSFKIFTLRNDFGKSSTLQIFSNLLKMLEGKTKTYKLPQNLKILWLGVVPLYYNNFIKQIEIRYNCTVVFEELFQYPNISLTSNTFYTDLAKRICACHFFSTDQRIHILENLINDLNVDAIIHFTQRRCNFLGPFVPNIREKLGKPFIELTGDVIIPKHFDISKCWNDLDSFFNKICTQS